MKQKLDILLVTAILFMGHTTTLLGQKVVTLTPKIGKTYNFKFSQERQELWTTCDSLMYNEFPAEKFTQEERNKLSNTCDEIGYSEACDDLWSIICGNDWTDEGYNMTYYMNDPNYKFTTVSSALKPQYENNYGSKSISDLSYKTAWVEGVKGYGIGETVAFKFPPGHPRITKVIIANGYIKDKNTWRNNSRVKRLKMYVNNKPFAMLNLEDTYAEQTFEIPTIGYKITYGLNNDGTTWWRYKDENGRDVKSYHENSELTADSIRFEILSVYKGDKYKDTAITEIYFDGLDVY
jgi:hypothetical protein